MKKNSGMAIGITAVAIVIFITTAYASVPNSIDKVRKDNEAKLLSIKGVSGVTVDKEADQIVVLIERDDVAGKIPKSIEGHGVRTLVTGRIEAYRSTPSVTTYSRTAMDRPIFGGISLGDPDVTAGTLGIVTTNGYILSNAHVMALQFSSPPTFLPIGTAEYQPGPYDGGNSLDTVGSLQNYIHITFDDPNAVNYADAAISSITAPDIVEQELNKQNNGFYTVSGTTTVNNGDTVRKSGRSSGVTTGKVYSNDVTVTVYYTQNDYAVFQDQIMVVGGSFSKPGDSGSAVDKNGKFVGLLFAGSSYTTIICKQEHIVNALGVTI